MALEARSKEFMIEREEKKKLEVYIVFEDCCNKTLCFSKEKIRSMNSQLLIGGRKIEETPQFRSALEEQQKIIRQQYEKRLQDLEKERQMIEEVNHSLYIIPLSIRIRIKPKLIDTSNCSSSKEIL